LDSSEKMYLGGGNGVRAYPQGEASGDQGYLLTTELRYQTNNPALQLVGFIDHGYVQGNHHDYVGAAENRTLSGAGLGLIYSRSKQYTLRLDYAWKLGDEDAVSDDDKNGRLWLRGTRYFE
ncbi:MAG: ShlB/FhaC/HecB family hemolysin secretion/activation protein, partial [Bacillota bacterium]